MLGWAAFGLWAGLGAALAVSFKVLGSGSYSSLQALSLAGAFAVLGVASAWLTRWLSNRSTSSWGGWIGYLAAVPPALQLGQAAGTIASQFVSGQTTNALIHAATFSLVSGTAASIVLLIGVVAGALCGSILFAAAGRLVPACRLGGLKVTWRSARIAILLAGLAGASGYYMKDRGVLMADEAEPPGKSAWIEREKSVIRAALQQHRFDVLVLPVQAEGASFDRIARSLMARYLAHTVAEQTGLRLPDQTLLARSFDYRARQVDVGEAKRFADAVGARTVIESSVTRGDTAFQFTARVWKRASSETAWTVGASTTLKDLRYSDERPPSLAFREAVGGLVSGLTLGQRPSRPELPSGPPGADAHTIADLLELAAVQVPSARTRALHLQLLATLFGGESQESEGLWERSLVALWNAPGAGDTRALEARAYHRLYRRPYALRLLGAPGSAEERALIAEMNGNVPALEAEAQAVEGDTNRLITQIVLADMYKAFGQTEKLKQLRDALLAKAPVETAILNARLSRNEWFSPEVHADCWALLNRLTMPARDFMGAARQWIYWLYWIPDAVQAHGLRLGRSVDARFERIWRTLGHDWASASTPDRLARWDYADLVFALNRASIRRSIDSMIFMQGIPEAAVDAIDALGRDLAEEPALAQSKAYALDRWGRQVAPDKTAGLFSRSSALAVAVYRWEQGETWISSGVEGLIFERKYDKYLDEPIRWYRRREVAPARQFMDRLHYSKREIEGNIEDARRRLAYAIWNWSPMDELVSWLKRSGDADGVAKVLQDNQHRFVGAAGRGAATAAAAPSPTSQEAQIEALRRSLERDPESRQVRWQLAQAYLEAGRYREVQELWLAYPGFARRDPAQVVALSNAAHEAGAMLFRSGQHALAEPLLLMSVRMGTGSAREMLSAEFLYLMRNDLENALRQALVSEERYRNAQDATRAIVYLHLLGRREEAWRKLLADLHKYEDAVLWIAAFIMHRAEGAGLPAVEEWLAQVAALDRRQTYTTKALRERHAFMIAYLDRDVDSSSIEFVRRVASSNNRSPYYLQIAEGYHALRKRDCVTAAQKLRGPFRDLFQLTVNRSDSILDLLPYMVRALACGGAESEARKVLDEYLAAAGTDSDYLTARGWLEGSTGQHERAIVTLRQASYRVPGFTRRTFPPMYALLEACEALLEQSGNDEYRKLMVDIARRALWNLPFPWAAAFEGKYETDRIDRRVAIGAATILDPGSFRIAQIPAAEREGMKADAARHVSALGTALRKR